MLHIWLPERCIGVAFLVDIKEHLSKYKSISRMVVIIAEFCRTQLWNHWREKLSTYL